jgi:hypothetical protein
VRTATPCDPRIRVTSRNGAPIHTHPRSTSTQQIAEMEKGVWVRGGSPGHAREGSGSTGGGGGGKVPPGEEAAHRRRGLWWLRPRLRPLRLVGGSDLLGSLALPLAPSGLCWSALPVQESWARSLLLWCPSVSRCGRFLAFHGSSGGRCMWALRETPRRVGDRARADPERSLAKRCTDGQLTLSFHVHV